MNSVLKSRLSSTFDPSWEKSGSGSIIRVIIRIYPIGSQKPFEEEFKFKRWCDPYEVTPHKDSFSIFDKAYEAYREVRRSLLSYTTVAVLRKENSVELTCRMLSYLWREYHSRGADVADGDYRANGQFFLELDLRRKPLDRLAIVQSLTGVGHGEE